MQIQGSMPHRVVRNDTDNARKFLRWDVVLVLLVAVVMFCGTPPQTVSADGPTITLDKTYYFASEIITVYGTGWTEGEAITILAAQDPSGWTVYDYETVDVNGLFTATLQLPASYIEDFTVTASGNLRSAPTLYASVSAYDQCSNYLGEGWRPPDTGCRWITGNLQSNNSRYSEGDSTVQRVWLAGFTPGTSHTLTFRYGTTKGGKHAYDFLTTWNWSEHWITPDDRCQNIPGCTTTAENLYAIPQDPNAEGFDNFARAFVMRGGTLTNVSTPLLYSGSYAGDSETQVTISFTVANSGDMCSIKQGVTTCAIAVWFGGHVAAQANWGEGNGASSIPGSPYHISLAALDGGSIGQRDNQMQADAVTAVANGTIAIVKDAIPNDPQNFEFQLTNNRTLTETHYLDDDDDLTLSNIVTFSVPPGTWYVTEMNIPAQWTLTKIECVPSTNTTIVKPTATINLSSNDTVTCTFTNEKDYTPASASLISFGGIARDGAVQLKWKTGTELNTYGFNVWRRARDGTYRRLNAELVPAQQMGQVVGAKYRFRDGAVKAGKTYRYKLELVMSNGQSEWSKVIRVSVP